ncbi:peptidase S8/S53 domain-containing protein [Apiospora arundinis]|uniref:Peptidase S8/S53 domain-containing protein n=1 Tax=Apiospora arundinis TaxID=335852 RepID=A0ABR2IHG1_9PEZI
MKTHHIFLLSLRWLLAAAASADVPSEGSHEVVQGAYIVEFDTPQHDDDFLRDLDSVDVSTDSHRAISSSIFQGASLRLRNNGSSSDHNATAARIAGLPHVKQLWPVRIYRPPQDDVVWVADSRSSNSGSLKARDASGRDDTFSPHVMMQVDRLRAEGYTGKGIKVAVLDTGVDYTHPALGGCFGPGCVVSFGADLVGDAYNGTNTPTPDDDPFESCPGSDHGTHVTGIIAAQANNPFGFSGAAPDVTLGMYKVFGCSGGVSDDVLMSAFLRAFDDGADIITASIGGSSGWSDTPSAAALNRIVEAGVIVTISAGNEGQRGMFFAGSGASADRVTAVAMVENNLSVFTAKRASFTVNNATTADFGWTFGTPEYATNVSLPLYATGNTTGDASDDAACHPLPNQTPDLRGFIVLVREPDGVNCTVEQQARNIFDRGGRYLLMYSTTENMANPWIYELPEFLGAAAVNRQQAATWIKMVAEGKEIVIDMTASKLAGTTFIEDANIKTGGYINYKSTWGPTWELNLKPTLATVGGNILSTFPVSKGGYGVLSGTSMAAPLAAAVYALVAQVRGTHDPSVLQRALMSTAQPNLWSVQPSAGLASVAQQGAGLAQAYDAAHVQTLLSVASFALNDSDYHVNSTRFSVQNTGTADMVYDLGHVPAASMNTFSPGREQAVAYPNPIAEGHAAVTFSATRLTVAAGQSVEVQVGFTPPAGLDPALLPVYSGYITLNGSSGAAPEALSIPYLGVVGSMRAQPMLDSSFFSMYNMTQYPEPIKQGDNLAFYLPYPVDFAAPMNKGVGWPYMQFRLHMGTRALHVELMGVPRGNGSAAVVETMGSIQQFPWFFATREVALIQFNGMLADGTVASEGRYFVRVRAQRLFADPTTDEGWDIRDFPAFDLHYTTPPPALGRGRVTE